MEVCFINPGIEPMLRYVMEFQAEDVPDFWSEPLYYFFPQLDRAYAASLSLEEKRDYIERVLSAVYAEQETVIEEKAALYTACWAKYRKQINQALSEAFEVDCDRLFNDLRCSVSLNPIEPRFLREHCFDIFYLNSEKGAIGETIHEIIHFVWFYVWNRTFGDSYEEYERPSLKWILSEMVVESVMRDPRLSSINPYFPRENGGCVYPYFFDMQIGAEPVLDTLDRMYKSQSIREFMQNSYAYCRVHEEEIRAHIAASERGTGA